jgi:toxin ParE1/3/4
MRVRWTTRAADDLTDIVEYIRKDNPAAARRLAQTIYQGIAALRTFPNSGRAGLAGNTRELVFSSYVVVYEIMDGQVRVLRIRHTAQDWP